MTSVPLPEQLLAETAWLRNLARKLVGDADLAADLQQDVTVAALVQPHAAAAGRSWLAAVAHHLAVTLRRRSAADQRRLHALPLRAPVPSPAELVATAELQQRAVAAVLALPPVYRDTVLLRFLRGLSLAATSQAMGVPEETVRTRQKRALAMLRAALAPQAGQRRGRAALLPSLAAWGVAMKIKHLVAAAAVAVFSLLLGVVWWNSDDADAGDARSPAPASVHADAGRVGEQTPGEREPSARTLLTAPAPRAPATTATLAVRVLWRHDRSPAAGVGVLCRVAQETGTVAVTDARGEVHFVDLAPADYWVETHNRDGEQVTLAAGTQKVVERELTRTFTVTGVVLDADGVAVAGAELLIGKGEIPPRNLWMFPSGHSDAAGRFCIEGLYLSSRVGARTARHGTSDFVLLQARREDLEQPGPIELRLPRGGCELRGRVVDRDGRAVARAWVQVGTDFGTPQRGRDGRVSQPPPASKCTTDAEGRFAAGALRAGEVDLVVYRQGFAPHRGNVRLDVDGPRDVLVTLLAGGVLTGTVRDGRGKVIAGARVSTGGLLYPQLDWQRTGDDGAFRFDDLPAGDLELEAIAAGFPPQRRTFTFDGAESQQWDVVLHAGATIHGRLVDHEDQPLAKWWISVPGVERRVRTDAAGRFLVAGCAPADNTLIVRDGGGLVPERTRFERVQPGEQEQIFVVPAGSAPSARLRGLCVTEDGAPLAGVGFDGVQHGWRILMLTKTGADGAFDVGPWPPGRYTLNPVHKDLVFAPIEVELLANESRDAGVQRGARPARLVVTLRGEAQAVAAAKVILVADGARVAGAGEAGERTFERVFPGHYRIVLQTKDGERAAGEITLAPGDDVARTVDLR